MVGPCVRSPFRLTVSGATMAGAGVGEFVEYLRIRQRENDLYYVITDGSCLGDGVDEMRIRHLRVGQAIYAEGDIFGG